MIKALKEEIAGKGLKVTPQRLAVLESLKASNEHPSAEMLIQQLGEKYPTISVGTVYRVLETFVEVGLVKRIKTDKDIMRYDAHLAGHHHLYCRHCNKVADYVDEELDELLKRYFINKNIPGFDIENIHVQIEGNFTHES